MSIFKQYSSWWLVMLLMFVWQIIDGVVAKSCQVLSEPSALCPDIVYATNVTDAKEGDKVIKTLLDKISREGLENANVDCFLSVRRALCLTHYRKCIPEEDGRFVPVCESVRTQTLEVCSQGGVFADWSVIEDHLDDDAFATSEDCVAVAAGANVADAKPEHEMVGDASTTTSPIPTPTATATPTDTQRTCTLDDMEPHYERYCETNGTMIMSMRRKSSAVCEDSDHFEQQMRTVQCACPKDRLRTFVSLCGPSGERTVIPYQPDATGQLCDRRLEVPEPHNETCIAAFTHTWADSQIRHNFTGLTWGLRTGCAPSKCFDGQDIWSRQDDATCRMPQENCPEWELSAEKAQSPSLSSNLTSFLEMAVASLDTAIRPAVIFIFSAISAMPVNSGLVVKLDDEERMALTGDQATPVGYEILLKPGQRHHLRWEWHGDNHTQTHAILHSFIMMESFIEINMHPLPGHATNVGTETAPTSQATEQATPTSDVSDKVTSTASASITFAELPNVTPVVTLNSTQITANINHQPARHPSDSATTAQKEQNPFEVATTDNDDDTTIDQVAVSRRSSGGVFVTIIFICLGIGLSGLFLWQRHTGRPNDHALGRWLKRRYAQVPHHPLLGGRRDTNSANKLSHDTSLEMQHFKTSGIDDFLSDIASDDEYSSDEEHTHPNNLNTSNDISTQHHSDMGDEQDASRSPDSYQTLQHHDTTGAHPHTLDTCSLQSDLSNTTAEETGPSLST